MAGEEENAAGPCAVQPDSSWGRGVGGGVVPLGSAEGGLTSRLALLPLQAALRQGCAQLRMHVSREKPANLDFLELRGGEDLTLKEGWHLLRLFEDSLQQMAAQSQF